MYVLPGVDLSQMLSFRVAIKPKVRREPDLLLFAEMNNHLRSMGLLEILRQQTVNCG